MIDAPFPNGAGLIKDSVSQGSELLVRTESRYRLNLCTSQFGGTGTKGLTLLQLSY